MKQSVDGRQLISDRNESGRSKPIMKANSLDKITFRAGKIQARLQKLVRANITTDVTNSEKSTFNFENVVLSAKKKVGKLSNNSQPFNSPSVAWTIRARSGAVLGISCSDQGYSRSAES